MLFYIPEMLEAVKILQKHTFLIVSSFFDMLLWSYFIYKFYMWFTPAHVC